MFTDCPSCESQFRIRAAQLGAADGWVRCGNCGETFYALERLYDAPVKQAPLLRQSDEVALEPLTESLGPTPRQPGAANIIREDMEPEQPVGKEAIPEHVEPEQPVEGETLPEHVEPEQPVEEATLPEDVEPEQPVEEETLPEDVEPEQPVEEETLPEDIEPEQPVEETTLPEHVEPEPPIEAETAAADGSRDALLDLPPVLVDDEKKKTGSPAPVLWGSLVFVLFLVAVFQLAWFNRDSLLRAYPALVPWVEKMCDSLQCDLIRFRDTSAIELLDRQVSQHPRYRNALLASATMVNEAGFIQAFPDIELLIFASDGQLISRGRFKPEEYLNPGVSPSSGMPPGVPIHFGLDLDGAAGDAVSFRFRFH